MLITLLACADGVTEPAVLPEDTGLASCELMGSWPISGSVVPPSGSVHAQMTALSYAHESVLEVDASGAVQSLGADLRFDPEPRLEWDTRHEMAIRGCPTIGFRTAADPGEPTVDAGTLWAIDLGEVLIAQPSVAPGGSLEIEVLVVLEVLSVGETIELGIARIDEGVQQDCAVVSTDNRLESGELIADFSGSVPLIGNVVDGRLVASLSSDGLSWEAGLVTFEQDNRALEHDLCALFAGGCTPCTSDGEPECIRFVLGDVRAEPWSGELQYCE